MPNATAKPVKNSVNFRETKHAYVLVDAPGDRPLKSCQGIGHDCRKTASITLTQDEWDIYFPDASTKQELLEINIQDRPEFIAYIQDKGLGM
jgi:hypothetical protein